MCASYDSVSCCSLPFSFSRVFVLVSLRRYCFFASIRLTNHIANHFIPGTPPLPTRAHPFIPTVSCACVRACMARRYQYLVPL